MKRCLTCYERKEHSEFLRNSPICRSCVKVLEERYAVEYCPPQKVSRREAMLSLIGAVRKQAESDKKINDFEGYWVRSDSLKAILLLIRDGIFQKTVSGSTIVKERKEDESYD